MPMLTFEAELQPYINQLGDSSLVQSNRAGKGYSLFLPSVPTKFTDAPNDGVSMPFDARHAIITIKNGGIRCRTDATNPSVGSGLYLPVGTVLMFKNQRQLLEQFVFVDSVGETSEVSAMWFA
jgi:hypothetical protein